MTLVKEFARQGGYVLGICNGFQILCEAGLLPGSLICNRSLQFRCEHVYLKVSNHESPFTCQIPQDKVLRIPIAHGEGNYFCDEKTLETLEVNRQILLQYVDEDGDLTDHANPNGSIKNIAGIWNIEVFVAGMMPHPDRASEFALNGDDGRLIFESLLHTLNPTLNTV